MTDYLHQGTYVTHGLPKIIKVNINLTKFFQEKFCLVFLWGHCVEVIRFGW